MGNDVALAVLSDKEPSLFSYFKQRFAQVTNPAIDSVREHIVMSLTTSIGPQGNLLDEDADHAQQVILGRPIVTDRRAREAPRRSITRCCAPRRSTSRGR